MSAAAGRTAGKVGQAVAGATAKANNAANEAAAGKGRQSVLNKGAKRDPELYILLTIMTGAFGMAGYFFGRKPTAASSEASVSMAEGTMPWQTAATSEEGNPNFKYKYHPGGDRTKAPKDAPSALHSVIVPNVTLPKSLHDQFNKYGKDDY
ncbi:hypothetical protein JMJ35_007735 [Cladonia borealis]|uniref:Uncharacterized protein n=1 Tax=Cladonia borealis TaxID=184061 RepID=A0AA39U8G0_9LECA|nr:hypothetical protein JMJ35_007735 [Cladonia borealis]